MVLSLGRIHPKKGLDRLVARLGKVKRRIPNGGCRSVGPDELGHAGELAALAAGLKARRISVGKIDRRRRQDRRLSTG